MIHVVAIPIFVNQADAVLDAFLAQPRLWLWLVDRHLDLAAVVDRRQDAPRLYDAYEVAVLQPVFDDTVNDRECVTAAAHVENSRGIFLDELLHGPRVAAFDACQTTALDAVVTSLLEQLDGIVPLASPAARLGCDVMAKVPLPARRVR